MSEQAHWAELGIEATADSKTIRKRYAQLLKKIDQRANPDQFQALRQAYEVALNEAAWMAHEQAQRQLAQEQETQQDGVSALSQASEQGQTAQEEIEPQEQAQNTSAEVLTNTAPNVEPAKTETAVHAATHTQGQIEAELSITEQHLEKWASDLCLFLNRGDKDLAIEALAQHLRSPLCERRETWLMYQARVIKLCLDEEQSNKPISFTFVKAAAAQFGWFDPDRQQDNFNDAALRTIRARILQQAATEAAEKYQTLSIDEARKFLTVLMQEEYLQGIEERDYFEACLLMQCTELALPLAAIDNISAHLNWDKENGHLWAIAPQECEKFRTRMQLLHKEKDTEEFRGHLYRVGNNLLDFETEPSDKHRHWRFIATPLLICSTLAYFAMERNLSTLSSAYNFLEFFLLFLLVAGPIAHKWYFETRTLYHPLIDIHAAQNILSSYRPIWLRWRAFHFERQNRTKEWLDVIETQHAEILKSLDSRTITFWRKKRPSVSRNWIFLGGVLSAPNAFIYASEFLTWMHAKQIETMTKVLLWLIALFLFSAAQIYFFCAVTFWFNQRANLIDDFLGKRILPARFQTLPSKGLSCTKMLLSSLAISGFLTIVALAFELNHRNSTWISCGVLAPITFLVCCWVYLTRFERFSNERKTEFLVTEKFGYQFQWWHLIIIFTALRTIGKAVS
ncbi:MAG: hypothetical protein K2Y28_02325 [Burkholderiaceae bacterium]|nr:hypothetical protein [Burkholderiaceae bacterium]